MKYFVKEVKDIEIEPMDHDGLRPIHVAVRFGHLDIVKYFIEEIDDIAKAQWARKFKTIKLLKSNTKSIS